MTSAEITLAQSLDASGASDDRAARLGAISAELGGDRGALDALERLGADEAAVAHFRVPGSSNAFRATVQGEKMSRTQRYVLAGVLTALLFIPLGLSQSTFGSITGSVKLL